jgi:hypothetical protein
MFRLTSRLPIVAAAVAAGALIGACGSHSPNSTGSSSSGIRLTYAQAQQDAVRFAGCLRAHGVTDFPDPTSPQEFKSSLGNRQQSPALQSAETACRDLLPGGGGQNQPAARGPAQITAELAFARCLRGHGFPNFPDPTTSGQLTHEMLAAAGINLHQPAVVGAADACVGVTHGFITRADVARFVAGH